MLSKRQKSVLEAVVQEYVATAEPVASAELVRKYRLPFSPATVRSELQALDEAGFLVQPHTSAGRVPTDKGYRFFINHKLPGQGAVSGREERAIRELKEFDDPFEFMRETTHLLAQITRSFAVAGFPDDELFFKSGISEVMRAPEFSDISIMQEFSALVDMIDDGIRDAFDPAEFEEPRTFVGHENPIHEARHWGMIISSCVTPFEKESIIALVGPKRMDYERNVAILKHFREMFVSEQ